VSKDDSATSPELSDLPEDWQHQDAIGSYYEAVLPSVAGPEGLSKRLPRTVHGPRSALEHVRRRTRPSHGVDLVAGGNLVNKKRFEVESAHTT
jgi:hypothetical protein